MEVRRNIKAERCYTDIDASSHGSLVVRQPDLTAGLTLPKAIVFSVCFQRKTAILSGFCFTVANRI